MTGPHQLTVEDLAQLIADLQDQVNDLQDDLNETVPEPPPPKPPPTPRRWADRATTKEWVELKRWVDHLTVNYSIRGGDYITPCWLVHPGVVEELAGLWRAWVAAVIADQEATRGATDMAEWHTNSLWPTLRRLQDNVYDTINCLTKREHVPTVDAPELTDPLLNYAPAYNYGGSLYHPPQR
jgi:hypothetical protein